MHALIRPSLLLLLASLSGLESAACSREEPDSGQKQSALQSGKPAATVTPAAFKKDPKACKECEKAHPGCSQLINICDTLEGNAKEGPKAGSSRKELCHAVMACVEKTDCARSHVSGCYCGTAQGTDCLDGKANGACKAEMEASLESVDPMSVARRYDEEAFAGSVAMWRYHCLHRECEKQCF